jgi:hypothetical protein
VDGFWDVPAEHRQARAQSIVDQFIDVNSPHALSIEQPERSINSIFFLHEFALFFLFSSAHILIVVVICTKYVELRIDVI